MSAGFNCWSNRFAVCLLALCFLSQLAQAENTLRALPAGELPTDIRLRPLQDLDGHFPFQPPATVEQWNARAEEVRRRIKVAVGLWPMPKKAPLAPVVHGLIDRGDYTVEKAYFESFGGLLVTGSLYRPKTKGPHPGVLCPHGHWPNGRFYDQGEAGVRKEIAAGAERFLEGGRSPLQSRCVQLARMGCVVFHYDMLGYADSTQLSFELVHRFAKQRPEQNKTENWGLFSPQAESRLQSVMGLQTLNSICALDFLESLDDVDPRRIAVTGASGGGTQTFLLCAIDPRPALSFPAVMVSTAMQGGCTCENASLLRIGTGNVEFAGLFAPKPQGMTAADDWTKAMPTDGFPQLKELYKTLGAGDQVMLKDDLQFGHNYNQIGRMAMYGWLNQHFKLGLDAPILENDYQRLTTEELTVFDDEHPRPAGGLDFEIELLRKLNEDSEQQLAELRPRDNDSWETYLRVVGGAADILIGRSVPQPEDLQYEETDDADEEKYTRALGLLRNKRWQEELPVLFFYPKNWNKQVVIWLSDQGKAGLLDEEGKPIAAVQQLIDGGAAVCGVDLFYQGEFLADGKPVTKTRSVKNPREAAPYTFGYNHSLFAKRVHDVLAVISFTAHHEQQPQSIALVGIDGSGKWAAAAAAQAGKVISKLAVDTEGFRFGNVLDLHDPDFLPGGAKYGDLPGFLSLAAPTPLWLAGEEKIPEIVASAYQAAGAKDAVHKFDANAKQRASAAAKWLLD